MHTGSENTINGKQYDIEMHVVHTPHEDQDDWPNTNSNFFATALGVMFDVDDYDDSVTDA